MDTIMNKKRLCVKKQTLSFFMIIVVVIFIAIIPTTIQAIHYDNDNDNDIIFRYNNIMPLISKTTTMNNNNDHNNNNIVLQEKKRRNRNLQSWVKPLPPVTPIKNDNLYKNQKNNNQKNNGNGKQKMYNPFKKPMPQQPPAAGVFPPGKGSDSSSSSNNNNDKNDNNDKNNDNDNKHKMEMNDPSSSSANNNKKNNKRETNDLMETFKGLILPFDNKEEKNNNNNNNNDNDHDEFMDLDLVAPRFQDEINSLAALHLIKDVQPDSQVLLTGGKHYVGSAYLQAYEYAMKEFKKYTGLSLGTFDNDIQRNEMFTKRNNYFNMLDFNNKHLFSISQFDKNNNKNLYNNDKSVEAVGRVPYVIREGWNIDDRIVYDMDFNMNRRIRGKINEKEVIIGDPILRTFQYERICSQWMHEENHSPPMKDWSMGRPMAHGHGVDCIQSIVMYSMRFDLLVDRFHAQLVNGGQQPEEDMSNYHIANHIKVTKFEVPFHWEQERGSEQVYKVSNLLKSSYWPSMSNIETIPTFTNMGMNDNDNELLAALSPDSYRISNENMQILNNHNSSMLFKNKQFYRQQSILSETYKYIDLEMERIIRDASHPSQGSVLHFSCELKEVVDKEAIDKVIAPLLPPAQIKQKVLSRWTPMAASVLNTIPLHKISNGAPNGIYLLVFNSQGGDSQGQGVYSMQTANEDDVTVDSVLGFFTYADALRYKILLGAEMNLIPEIELVTNEEIRSMLSHGGFECRVAVEGMLIVPPTKTVERTDWERTNALREGRWSVKDKD